MLGKFWASSWGFSGVSILIGFAPLRDGSNEFIGINRRSRGGQSLTLSPVFGVKRFRSLGVDSVVYRCGSAYLLDYSAYPYNVHRGQTLASSCAVNQRVGIGFLE